MSSDNRELYQQVILEHNKKPRNFRELGPDAHHAKGYNPLCGDQVTVYLRESGGVIEEVTFQGNGCAIAKASASLMTTLLQGKTVEEARALFEKFHAMVTSEPGSPLPDEDLGRLMVFSGVREYPVRIKCATLAWHTLLAALKGEDETVSTE